MKRIGKIVAMLVGIALFAMPAVAMPLHCILMVPSGAENPHPCHMMAGAPSADRIGAVPPNLSCCRVSAAKPEAVISPQAPSSSGLLVQPAVSTLLLDPPDSPVVHEPPDWATQSRGTPPQALLCTFLV